MHRSRGAWRSADREYANGAARRRRARHIISLNERTAIDRGLNGFTTRMLSVPRPPKLQPSPPSSHLVPPSSCSLLLSIYSPQSVFTQHYTPCPVALSRLPRKQSPASIELSNSTSKQQYNTPCVPSHTNHYTSRTPIPTNARLLPSALATLRQSSPI